MKFPRFAFSCVVAICFFCIGWISSNLVSQGGVRLERISHLTKSGILGRSEKAKRRSIRPILHASVTGTTENISVKAEAYLKRTPAVEARGKMENKGATSDIKFTETAKNVPETPSTNTPAVGFRGTAQNKGASSDIKSTPEWKGKIAEFESFDGAYDIGSKMELFFDDFIISKASYNIERSTSKKTRQSQVVLKLEYPWEMSTGYLNYASVVENEQDGSFLMYYRCYAYRLGIDKIPPWNKTRPYANDRNYCVAKSTDGGKTFTKPLLDYYRWGTKNVKTNIIAVMLDAFTPIYDGRPNVPQSERFKAFGSHRQNIWNLYASSDGTFSLPRIIFYQLLTHLAYFFCIRGSFNDW